MKPKPITPRAARKAAKLTVQALAWKIPCSQSTWFLAEGSEKWPTHGALRQSAIAILHCEERDGQVYAK